MLREYDIERLEKFTCCDTCYAKITNFIDQTELTYEEVTELSDRLYAYTKKTNTELHEQVVSRLNKTLDSLKPVVKIKKEKKNVNKKHNAS